MKTWEGDEDANLEECKLLSGQFAALLQVLLGLIALSVLVFKRLRETPRRPLAVWAFDASKQMIGAGFAHVANLLIAILLYSYEDSHASSSKTVDQVSPSGGVWRVHRGRLLTNGRCVCLSLDSAPFTSSTSHSTRPSACSSTLSSSRPSRSWPGASGGPRS
jgi:hypothetical protein